MNNLFIAENLKAITKVLPILKIQMHQKEISLIVKKNHLIPVSNNFIKKYTVSIKLILVRVQRSKS